MRSLPIDPHPLLPFKDRSGGLVVFGIVTILFGALYLLMAAAASLSLLMPTLLRKVPATTQGAAAIELDVRAILISAFTNLALAGALIALGIGSVRLRRWSRPLTLSLAWTWLLTGIVSFATLLIALPNISDVIRATDPNAPKIPDAMFAIIVVFSVIVSLFLFIALPLVYILFYRSPHVRLTLEHFDPDPSWTDRCPLPVLGLAIGLGIAALGILLMLAYNVVPVFGALATGLPAAILVVAMAAWAALLARQTYRLELAGWWGTMAFSIGLTVSGAVTFFRYEPAEFYEMAGVPASTLAVMRANPALSGPVVAWGTLLLGAACVGYLLTLRKFFPGVPSVSKSGA